MIPEILKIICPPRRRFDICVIPNTAMLANIASAQAAPKPEMMPDKRDSSIVLRMHRIPIGPTGAAIDIPRIKPLRIMKNSNNYRT